MQRHWGTRTGHRPPVQSGREPVGATGLSAPRVALGLVLVAGLLGVAGRGVARADLSPPPPPATATMSAILSEQAANREAVDRHLAEGDRALHLGAPVVALEQYELALVVLLPGDAARTDVLLRLATAEAALSDCPRAMARLTQVAPALRADPEKTAARTAGYRQIVELCGAR